MNDNYLDFKDYQSWMPKLQALLSKHDIQVIINRFKDSDKYLEVYDVIDILGNEIVCKINEWIEQQYKHIIFYHATSTNNLKSYLIEGLLPMNVEQMLTYVRSLFNQKDFPEITDEKFQKAVNSQNTEQREGIICFAFDSDELFEEASSHYLVYGSEYVLHIAQNLGKQYPKYLESVLTPTLFKCKISISDLDKDTLMRIAENLLVRCLEFLVYHNEKLEPIYINPYLTKNLEAENLLSYEHPINIKCDIRKTMYGCY